MKLSLPLASVLAAAAFTSFFPLENVQASSFGEQQVDSERFVLVAAPYRHGYNLMIIEQIPGRKQCWDEIGAYPTSVEPLLVNFDFSNHCKRSTDSNSYSIRLDGQDLGMDYLPDIVKKDGELHLIGTPRNPRLPELEIGRTYGLNSGSLKIVLNREWNLSKRTYGGDTVEHVYLSSNYNLAEYTNDRIAKSTNDREQPSVIVDTITPQTSQFNSGSQGDFVNYGQETSNPVIKQPNPVYSVPSNPPVYQQQQPTPVYSVPSNPPVYQQQPPTYVYQQQPTPVYSVPSNPPVYQQQPPTYVYQQQPTPVYSVPSNPPVYQQQPPTPVYSVPPNPPVYQQQQPIPQ